MGKATLVKMVAGSGLLLGLVLTGCGAPQGQQAGSVASTTSASPSRAAVDNAQGMSCTNKIDYTGDERSNAEINSIGAQTGTCPPVQKKTKGTKPAPAAKRCTDQINYAGDQRSNAEINSIGAETGTCPPVRKPPATQPSPDMSRCTDKIDYSNDPRSNAEINSIGVETGKCPEPQH